MGYSHYFNNMELGKSKFLLFSDQCKRIINIAKEQDIQVQYDQDDNAKPLLRNDEVQFNGIESEGHETFCLTADPNSDFCKTLQKPYDTVVTACLLAFKMIFRSKVDVRTDGTAEDWSAGFELYNKALNMNAQIMVKDLNNDGQASLINKIK